MCIIFSIQEINYKNNIKTIKFNNKENNNIINNYIILPGYSWGLPVIINKKIIKDLYNLLLEK